MMEKGLLSVIVPAHNAERYLRRCISSILKAADLLTAADTELLIINDGSIDKTAQLCESLCREDARIRVITMDDEGVSAARNRGLSEAKGESVTFVDADDRIAPDMLNILFEALWSTDAGIAGCGFSTFDENTAATPEYSQTQSVGIWHTYAPGSYLTEVILKGNSRCWSKLYRREAIKDVRFHEDLSIGEDMLFVAEAAEHCTVVECSDYLGYGYYVNAQGAMNRPFTLSYMDQVRCWERMQEAYPSVMVQTHLLIGIMLTMSKLARLPRAERKLYRREVAACRDKVKRVLSEQDDDGRSPYMLLDRGYRIKVRLFFASPGLYLALYHIWKA